MVVQNIRQISWASLVPFCGGDMCLAVSNSSQSCLGVSNFCKAMKVLTKKVVSLALLQFLSSSIYHSL